MVAVTLEIDGGGAVHLDRLGMGREKRGSRSG
jgi:hypothetical protein